MMVYKSKLSVIRIQRHIQVSVVGVNGHFGQLFVHMLVVEPVLGVVVVLVDLRGEQNPEMIQIEPLVECYFKH